MLKICRIIGGDYMGELAKVERTTLTMKETAEYLVIRGFLGPVILSMPSQKVRDELMEVIDHKLMSIKADDLND